MTSSITQIHFFLSLQPSRGGKSVTEVALEKLIARKRELEGTPESVERRTEVRVTIRTHLHRLTD